MHYRLATPANADLEEIWRYIAEDDPVAADHLIDLLHEKFSLLTAYPHIGRSCDAFATGLRRIPAVNYIVFYRVAPDHIEIARVLHGARDIEAIFEEQGIE